MSSPTPQRTAGPTSRQDAFTQLSTSKISKDSMRVDRGTVQRDGYMPSAEAEEIFGQWLSTMGKNSGDEMKRNRVLFAISCSAGTSAETNFRERFLEEGEENTCVANLMMLLEDSDSLRNRTNKLRVLCRSLLGFPELTHDVILENNWLAAERAADYELDLSMAGICFDYADALIGKVPLQPKELSMMKHALRYKASGGRPMIYSAEGQGVRGSDPASRGVAATIVPDTARVSGGRYGSSAY